ncbi:MAG: SET domain-containing protein [Planctomycetota bacterium]|jgi:hypothetical protein
MARTFKVGRHEVPESPWISPKVTVGPSPGRGAGLFAAEPIPAGETVIVWGGPSYTGKEGAARTRAEGRGTMQWDDDLYSCEGDDHDAFAINHSCDPNVWMKDTFTLIARRAIPDGQELFLDYAMLPGEEDYRAEWECHCPTPDCRGRITGQDWKLDVLRKRYAGHFVPSLNRRIAEDAGRAD